MTFILLLFILGLSFGSFASVLITRLEDEISWAKIKGILFGFSKCPKCSHKLGFKDLIPLVSFLGNKGKCRYCKKNISWIYPVLELGSGIVFVVSFLLVKFVLGLSGNELVLMSIFRMLVNRILFSLLIYDFQKKYLHTPMRVLGIVFSLLIQIIFGIGDYLQALIFAGVFAVIFAGFYFGSRLYLKLRYKKTMDGMGDGDIMMAGLIGLLMPFVFEYNNLNIAVIGIVELFLVFVILCGVVGLLTAALELGIQKIQKKNIDGPVKLQAVAFLPSMIVSFWILLIFGAKIMSVVFPDM